MDHYTTLGVSKTASPEEIKKAYRKLASQHHPDKGGDTVMFQKIEEAYRTLSDPNLKAQYDNPVRQQQGFPGGFDMFFGDMNMGDIFSHMFNQRQGAPFGPQRHGPQVFRTQVTLTLEDAYRGVSQVLKLQTPTGQKIINIEVPRGVQTGNQIKYDNIIDKGILVVEFKVNPDLRFERKGNDLYCNHSISVLDLIVGTKFNFTTISGKTLEVSIQPKTQPFMQLKIAGEGMPIVNSNAFGDQIVLLKPFVPDTIDDEITQSILRSRQK